MSPWLTGFVIGGLGILFFMSGMIYGEIRGLRNDLRAR